MTIDSYLRKSLASDGFRTALTAFGRGGRTNDRIIFDRMSPPVKVERLITKMLVEYPLLPIESIEVRASSGCEYFRGVAIIRTASEERHVRFSWDCKWRAEEQGWKDYFGFADQIRAAREFGWDCFRSWVEEEVVVLQQPARAPVAAELELPMAFA
ncbi:MAG TPA: hypothetical protein VE913_21935 [Longimicrobium sp.]|nr:hypothetical protein [Longimicrobium sp.]